MSEHWAILRCSNCKTLELAASLNDAGFEAWTPVEEIQKIIRGKPSWVMVPMFPSIVFAGAARMADLFELSRSPALCYLAWDSALRRMTARGTPSFHMLRVGSNYAVVPEAELAPIRRIEGRRNRKPRGKPREWEPGDRVRLTEGAYEGLRGVVTAVRGKQASVIFPGSKLSFDVSAFVLIPDLDEPGWVKVKAA